MAIAFFQAERRKRRRVVENPVGEGLLAERPKTSSPIAGLDLFLIRLILYRALIDLQKGPLGKFIAVKCVDLARISPRLTVRMAISPSRDTVCRAARCLSVAFGLTLLSEMGAQASEQVQFPSLNGK